MRYVLALIALFGIVWLANSKTEIAGIYYDDVLTTFVPCEVGCKV